MAIMLNTCQPPTMIASRLASYRSIALSKALITWSSLYGHPPLEECERNDASGCDHRPEKEVSDEPSDRYSRRESSNPHVCVRATHETRIRTVAPARQQGERHHHSGANPLLSDSPQGAKQWQGYACQHECQHIEVRNDPRELIPGDAKKRSSSTVKVRA